MWNIPCPAFLYNKNNAKLSHGSIVLVDKVHHHLHHDVLLIRAALAELLFQVVDSLHGILIRGSKLDFGGRPLHKQLLIIIPVKGVESIGIVCDHIYQFMAIPMGQLGLRLDGASKNVHQLAELFILLRRQPVIDGITLARYSFNTLLAQMRNWVAFLLFTRYPTERIASRL